ncbi:hypothetical protein Tco_0984753 [Tanacetum coccineum]
MTEKVEAYDSDCDDVLTASEIFMAKLSPTRSYNGDKVGPSYDSDILSEPISVNDTYVDFLSDSNVIFDNPDADNNEKEVVQDMSSLAQNDDVILSLIENMEQEVARYNTVNLESKQVN